MYKDMTGETYSYLTVVRQVANTTKNKDRYWLCRCVCGVEKAIAGGALRLGRTKSCGCKKAAMQGHPNATHGMHGTPTYGSWHHMKRRCNSNHGVSHKDYKARGISYDPRWNDFSVFLADMGPRPTGTSLDRIDNDRGYSKGNCRWADRTTQQSNRRCTIRFQGMTIPEWSANLKVSTAVLHRRMRLTGSVHLPVKADKPHHLAKLYEGKTLRVWSEELHVPITTLKARLKNKGTVQSTARKQSRAAKYLYEGRTMEYWAKIVGESPDLLRYRFKRTGSIYKPEVKI